MTDTSQILNMFGLVQISYKIILLSVFIIKIEKKKEKQNLCFLVNIFCLLNVSRSMHSGNRKEMQITAVLDDDV